MKYLFSHPDKFIDLLGKHQKILCAFDLDGTLTPLRKRPQDTVVSPEVKRLLKRLARHPRLALAIISGRSLKDVLKLVRIKGIYYSGNHGLELRAPRGKTRVFYNRRDYQTVRRASRVVKKKLAHIKGVIIEDKGIMLGIHYRMVPLRRQARLVEAVKNILAGLDNRHHFCLGYGKKFVEFRPRLAFSKGMVLKRIMNQPGLRSAYPIYFGDDLTDEDAFKVVSRRNVGGLGVLVGSKRISYASYFVKNTSEVKTVLKLLTACSEQ